MSDPQSGWGVGTGARGSAEYADGAFKLTTTYDGAYVWSTRPVTGTWDALRVEGTTVAEPDGTGFIGLMCGNAADQSVAAIVSSDGGWVFGRTQGEQVSVLDADLDAGIDLGQNDFINLVLDCVSSASGATAVTLYVNSEIVASHETAEGIGAFDRVAVYAEGETEGYTAYFDEVRVLGATDGTSLPPVVSADIDALLAHVPADFAGNCQCVL